MPATMPATSKNAPFRGACLTIFGKTHPFEGDLPDRLAYFAYGEEVCSSTGRQHLQCFAYSKKAMKFSGWKKIFPCAHIECMKGTFTENAAYCSKEGKLIEFGVRPMDNGHRRGDLVVKAAIDADPTRSLSEVYDITEERAALVYTRAFEAYREYKRHKTIKDDRTAPVVTYVHGLPGTGKTRYVRELEPDVYVVPDGFKWFNGYCGQEAVLFDNLELPIVSKSFFLQLIDRYLIQVPTKGGFTWWKPKRIYITSVHEPEQVASAFTYADEFNRRISVYKSL